MKELFNLMSHELANMVWKVEYTDTNTFEIGLEVVNPNDSTSICVFTLSYIDNELFDVSQIHWFDKTDTVNSDLESLPGFALPVILEMNSVIAQLY